MEIAFSLAFENGEMLTLTELLVGGGNFFGIVDGASDGAGGINDV